MPLVDAGPEGHSVSVMDRLVALGPEASRTLADAGAFSKDDKQRHPNWIVRAAYHWTQDFPARREVTVEHVYRPVLGGVLTDAASLGEAADQRRWCTGPDMAAAAGRLPGYGLMGAVEQSGPVRADWLVYILKTGANWAGPIGRFHLEIAADDADLVSSCPIAGLTWTKAPRALVADGTDFTPASDLDVLYISGNCRRHPCPSAR